MFNFLKVIRYLVFFVFIISNAIVTSVAVWNLTIIEGSTRFSTTAIAAASYLIAVATTGLFLIFPIIFLEISGKRTFFGRVWFELTWTGLFGMMTLIGASIITSISSRELCIPPAIVKGHLIVSPLASSCTSAQVMGAFTWIPATLLLAYMTLLSILSFIQSKEDPSTWRTPVWDLPVERILGEVRRNSIALTLPQIRKSPPVIHAPKPRYIIPPLLDCRSTRNSAYEFQPPALPAKSAPVQQSSWYQPPAAQQPYTSTSFYNVSVQKAIAVGSGVPPPLPVQSVKGRRVQTSPPPLGDWPRLDATSRPRTKRYPRAVPEPQGPLPLEPSIVPRSRSSRRLPSAPSSATPLPIVERSTVPHRTSRTRTRPPSSGHLRSTGSIDSGSGSPSQHRPPPLDLSNISSHRTRSQRSRTRAGR